MNSPRTPETPGRLRLSVGEWIGIISLCCSLLGGLVDLRVQVATLRNDVAGIRHDLDRNLKVAHVDSTTKAPRADGRDEGQAVLSSLVQIENLGRKNRATPGPIE